MLILVTGSTGFIGSQICHALVADGHTVRAFHRESSQLTLIENLQFERAIGDVTDIDSVEIAMRDVEVVYHTAARLGQKRNLESIYKPTVSGTRNVLQAAINAGVKRFVHTSSVAALGVPSETQLSGMDQDYSQLLMDENHTWNFPPQHWRYGHAKYLAEIEVQKAVAKGLDAVIVNPAVVLGPGDINQISGGVIVHAARRGLPVAAPGGLNVVHIEEVVRGHLAACNRGRTGERYILGGENLSIKRFGEIVAEVVGVQPPDRVIPARVLRALSRPVSTLGNIFPLPIAGEALYKAGYNFYYDTSKMVQELGVEITHSTRECVQDTYNWYRENKIIN
jgi:dihydroflavonol-4-reductase